MRTPHLGPVGLCILVLSLLPTTVLGQDADAWRTHFAAGEEARQAGDAEAYADAMASAAEVMPPGMLNRPFVQYHAARGAAMAGRDEEAVAFLAQAWEEDIEALMISFAPYDPAFETIADSEGFQEVMGRAADMELEVRSLAEGVYRIGGAGSNVVAVVDGADALVVDTGYGPALPALRRALASVGASDITRVVVTHPHEDHMGATPTLGRGAIVMAHPGTGAVMSEPYVFMEGVELPPKPLAAHPAVAITSDTTFAFGQHRVRLVPTVAHTIGDLTVYLPDARVAHFGDTYLAGNPMMFPGSEDPDGFLDRVDGLIAEMHPETVAIGGHDGPTDLAAVREQVTVSRAAMAFTREALADGLTMEQAVERAADRFPAQWVGFFYRLFSEDPG
ncbi:MAG: MBL fold metallo-hydrolase [Gemmatimonadetes bacterium]|nr:MBL fold metallo-hydrolase [Gemmatimonadota bacterium]